MNTRLLSITAGTLIGLSLIFFIISNALPIWNKFGTEYQAFTYGLWRSCVTVSNMKQCVAITCPSENDEIGFCSKILVARAFVTISCVLSGISAICLLVYTIIGDSAPRVLLLVAKGLVLACLIMGIIGVAVGINAKIDTGSEVKLQLGAAAIIGIVAIIINFFGIIATLSIRQ
ncbi:unnamed protein product [Rotaria sordida]|uniref:Claudin n=2 Tax=Rotaria sordida TaxID=392033 RepID=A0A815SVG3_9BILA|nr:unnamed protein product [Rotaria sordida]CAF1494773.1 unnamed protein product [Rotaria sordida]CAF4049379.1 unnamed protein product [Rotaria sordida]